MVPGNKVEWTKISGVEANTLIKVRADWDVNFGGLFSTSDSATAGVEGNALLEFLQRVFPSNWEDVVANPKKYPELIKNAFIQKKPVNFNQGGVWIKIVNRNTGGIVVPGTLYYYWANCLNKFGLMSDSAVDVYAKAHDGGKNPDDTGSYGDNTGTYKVWLELAKPSKVPWTLP